MCLFCNVEIHLHTVQFYWFLSLAQKLIFKPDCFVFALAMNCVSCSIVSVLVDLLLDSKELFAEVLTE